MEQHQSHRFRKHQVLQTMKPMKICRIFLIVNYTNKLNKNFDFICFYRATEKLNVDASQPTTSIQIRLADGSRLSGRFNLSHTIDDIRTFITK